ncbi:MAG: hypothetical protein JWL77_3143 [Chthonomonadaceae bacterium]|nr:hypothetical protein [Chthonomonadaceae bacterium]
MHSVRWILLCLLPVASRRMWLVTLTKEAQMYIGGGLVTILIIVLIVYFIRRA